MLRYRFLQTVILFSFLRPFSYQFGTTMDAIGKPRINFWVNLLTMCLNYGCMYLGLRYIGWLGAAYGTVVSAILIIPDHVYCFEQNDRRRAR